MTLLGLVVVRVDLRPELHLLDDGLLLVTPRFARLQCALVLELAEVHELAHRRARHRRNLDQVQVDVRGQLKGALQRDDAHLLTLGADQSDLTCPDLLVHAWFDADGASSSRVSTWPTLAAPGWEPTRKAEGPGACQGPLDRSARSHDRASGAGTCPEPVTGPGHRGGDSGGSRRSAFKAARTGAMRHAGSLVDSVTLHPARTPSPGRAARVSGRRRPRRARRPLVRLVQPAQGADPLDGPLLVGRLEGDHRQQVVVVQLQAGPGAPRSKRTPRTTSQGSSYEPMTLRTRTPRASASTRGRVKSRTPERAEDAEPDHGDLVAALEAAVAIAGRAAQRGGHQAEHHEQHGRARPSRPPGCGAGRRWTGLGFAHPTSLPSGPGRSRAATRSARARPVTGTSGRGRPPRRCGRRPPPPAG